MNLYHKLQQSSDMVYGYLTNMEKYTSVHPWITKIDHLKDQSFLVHERFLSTPLMITYPVTIHANDQEKTIEMNARIFKLITVNMKFRIRTETKKTIVSEEIKIGAPFPIKNIMESIFKKQHTTLFENINKAII